MIKEQIEIEADDSALKASAAAADDLADALDRAAHSAHDADDALKKTRSKVSKDGSREFGKAVAGPVEVAGGGAATNPAAAGGAAPKKKKTPEEKEADAAAKAAKKEADAATKKKEKDAAKVVRDAEKASKAKAKSEKDATKKVSDANKAKDAAYRNAQKAWKVRDAETRKRWSQLGGAIKSVGAFALTAATVGVGALVAGIKSIGDVKIKRDNIRAALNEITRGRGADAFKKLDALARGLGQSTEDVADQFIALRKRGIDNVNSSKLIKLRADLVAVGVDAETADAAVGRAADQIQRTGNADGAIKMIAKRYGAVGDGSNAAAKSAYTLEGAFGRAQRLLEDVVGVLADELGPAITDVVNAFLEGFGAIDKNTKADALKNLKKLVKDIAPAAKAAAKAIGFMLEVFNATADFVSGKGVAFSELRDAVHETEFAFSHFGEAVMGALRAADTAVNDAVGGISTGITDGIKASVDAAKKFVGDFVQLGKDFVAGLIDGITAGIPGLDAAASNAASTVEKAQRKTLQTHSPSRKAMAIAGDWNRGLNQTLDKFEPSTRGADALANAYAANDNGARVAKAPTVAGAVSQSSREVTINSHITVQGNASQETAAQIAKLNAAAIEAVLRRIEAA